MTMSLKTRPLAVALLLALAPATFPTVVLAQPADDATTTMARARFKEGVEFYDKGDFEQARASFLQAYALKNHPAVLLNLAWSCVKSGHALEAEKYFKKFLAEGKDITDKQRADANDGLTQSRAKLGRIEIAAAAGTEVMVDGEKVGTTPLTDPVSVEAGAHTVKFKGADGTTDTQSVTVLGGEKQTARFGKAGPATPPAETKPPPASTSEPAPEETKPAPEEAKPAETKPSPPGAEAHGSNLLSPPATIWPALVLGVATVGGVVGAVVTGVVFKNQAQNQANSTAAQIIGHGGGSGTCSPPIATNFQQACSAYTTDNNQVNQDATAGNILAGVAVVGAVGFVAYWLLADKGDSSKAASLPVVTPYVGRSGSGMSLSASF
jgi:Tfp pilus assembly protein PilF